MQLQVSEGIGRLAFPSSKKTSWGQEPLIALPAHPVWVVTKKNTAVFVSAVCLLPLALTFAL